MVMQVNLLIYIYMLLCICVLLFNLITTGRRKLTDVRNPKKVQWWEDCIIMLINQNKKLDITDKQFVKLEKKLSKVSQLLLFNEALELVKQKVEEEKIQSWLVENRVLFIHIGRVYMKQKVMVKAYYAYLMWQYRLCGDSVGDPIVKYMFNLVTEQSPYCRENALQALYTTKNPENVVRAYLLLVRHDIKHSDRLVADGLLAFKGDKVQLAQVLWEHFDEFAATPYYQTALINFMRLATGDFREQLLPLLHTKIDREVKFAIVRYYRRYYYKEAEPILWQYAQDTRADSWEFISQAAAALETYPSSKSVHILIKALRSRNWYVRDNASNALVKIVTDDRVFEEVLQGSDQYAKEMLQYKLDIKRIASEKAIQEVTKENGCN